VLNRGFLHTRVEQSKQMDEYVRAAQQQLDMTGSVPPAAAPSYRQQPTMPQIVVNTVPQATAPVSLGFYSRVWLYIAIGFVFLLLTYVSVQYAKDVRNRDVRDKRHNLHAYVEYSSALANRLPHGHVMSNTERLRLKRQGGVLPRVPARDSEEESEEKSESSDEDDGYIRAKS
jgi:hypothetical protein